MFIVNQPTQHNCTAFLMSAPSDVILLNVLASVLAPQVGHAFTGVFHRAPSSVGAFDGFIAVTSGLPPEEFDAFCRDLENQVVDLQAQADQADKDAALAGDSPASETDITPPAEGPTSTPEVPPIGDPAPRITPPVGDPAPPATPPVGDPAIDEKAPGG